MARWGHGVFSAGWGEGLFPPDKVANCSLFPIKQVTGTSAPFPLLHIFSWIYILFSSSYCSIDITFRL